LDDNERIWACAATHHHRTQKGDLLKSMPLTRTHVIDEHTRLVGLIGRPLENGLSLKIYNTAFDALHLNWRCVSLPVPERRLREALHGLPALGFAGAEVRGVYQNQALDRVDEVTLAAETIGAVNLIQVDGRGSLVGDNTRWCCFVGELRTIAPSLNGLRPLIIGAGETARGVVYALMREGLPVTIVDRDVNQAIDLVHRLRHVLDEHSLSVYRWPHDLAQVAHQADLIVNTIPLGMWPGDLPISPDAIVFDLTQPGETRFLRQARASGARAVSGLALLVYEAALALERWTGQTPPLDEMFRVAEQALAQQTPWDEPRSADTFVPAIS
jgi:shikimate dehydrogenase